MASREEDLKAKEELKPKLDTSKPSDPNLKSGVSPSNSSIQAEKKQSSETSLSTILIINQIRAQVNFKGDRDEFLTWLESHKMLRNACKCRETDHPNVFIIILKNELIEKGSEITKILNDCGLKYFVPNDKPVSTKIPALPLKDVLPPGNISPVLLSRKISNGGAKKSEKASSNSHRQKRKRIFEDV